MYKLLIGIFAVFVASAVATQLPCNDVNATVVKCMLDNGFANADVSWLVSGGFSFDAQAVQKLCDQMPQYKAASQCLISEFNRCSLGDGIISNSSIAPTFQTWDVICNDPKFKLDCFVQVGQHSAELLACIAPHVGTASDCEMSKLGFQCTEDLFKKCDAYSGTMIEGLADLAVPKECAGSIVG